MMKINILRPYLMAKKGTTEETPFGDDALVFKVIGKMFALVAWQSTPLSITLKCDPNDALALRDQYEAVQAGYHMNKKHWNTITLDGAIPQTQIEQMIDHSYALVVKGLRKADREMLQNVVEQT